MFANSEKTPAGGTAAYWNASHAEKSRIVDTSRVVCVPAQKSQETWRAQPAKTGCTDESLLLGRSMGVCSGHHGAGSITGRNG